MFSFPLTQVKSHLASIGVKDTGSGTGFWVGYETCNSLPMHMEGNPFLWLGSIQKGHHDVGVKYSTFLHGQYIHMSTWKMNEDDISISYSSLYTVHCMNAIPAFEDRVSWSAAAGPFRLCIRAKLPLNTKGRAERIAPRGISPSTSLEVDLTFRLTVTISHHSWPYSQLTM